MTADEGPEQPAPEPHTIRFSREMGITHAEFFRGLPDAVGRRPYTLQPGEVWIAEGKRRIAIKLSTQSERTLGSLRLPTTQVGFTFSGYSKLEVECFMMQFNMHFQRGGG